MSRVLLKVLEIYGDAHLRADPRRWAGGWEDQFSHDNFVKAFHHPSQKGQEMTFLFSAR